MLIDNKFRKPRKWSNNELKKFSKNFYGNVINISGWKDSDKQNSFYKNYLKMGYSGIIGGTGLGIAMISFIYSITNTSAAITLLCLAAMPFFYCASCFFIP